MIYKKRIGSILMILGTSVGAGMLALPIVTAEMNFTMSMILLCLCWLMMTVGAYSLLEVNLWLPKNTNMISMAGITLGPLGKILTWIIYLLLLYSLICAYLSGLSDILQSLLMNIHIYIPIWLSTLFVLMIFGTIVYRGISSVDIINRALMTIKLLAYVLLVFIVSRHMNVSAPFQGEHHWQNSAFMVMVTSFGYAIIIPSLRNYLEDDHRALKKVVLIGSLIPLVLYALWIFVIQGLIPRIGDMGLINMLHSNNTNSMLMNSLSAEVNMGWITEIVKLFISICAVTSFLGVSICLTDFVADGLHLKKVGKSGIFVYLVSYLPPLFIVLISPGIFVKALNYAGIWCLILLIIIPLCMLYFGRYKRGYVQHMLLPGKVFVISSLLVSFYLLLVNIIKL